MGKGTYLEVGGPQMNNRWHILLHKVHRELTLFFRTVLLSQTVEYKNLACRFYSQTDLGPNLGLAKSHVTLESYLISPRTSFQPLKWR